jgi:hypothetical protein
MRSSLQSLPSLPVQVHQQLCVSAWQQSGPSKPTKAPARHHKEKTSKHKKSILQRDWLLRNKPGQLCTQNWLHYSKKTTTGSGTKNMNQTSQNPHLNSNINQHNEKK